MIENVSLFQEFIGKYQIEKPGEKLITCIKKYTFLYASEKLNLNENPLIQENLRQTKTLLIKKYQNKSKLQSYHGYILSFEKTLIIIDNLSVDIFNELLTINPKLSFLFYHKNKINETGVEKIKMIIPHEEFDKEVEALSQSINLNVPKNTTIHSLYLIFRSCISCYLIQKSYQKLNKNRLENQNSESQNTDLLNNIEESDYIELRFIDVGSSFLVYLIYLIEKEELLVIKKPKNQNQKLIERVCNNCPYLNHPFFPKFYGKVKNTDYLVMEFIYGKKLNSININEYSDSDIYMIIFELIISIKYLHNNHFIFRDLKTDNIMIDQNKTAIIVDFDRMIKHEDVEQNYEHTNNFQQSAPEVNSGHFSYECDIYSLGKIIEYLISQRITKDNHSNKYFAIQEIYKQCMNENHKNRPSISQLIENFNVKIKSQLKINDFIYYTFLSSVNDANGQFNLGVIYASGEFVARNIDKAIHYFTLAANQNHLEAQFNLGFIYVAGTYVTRDIDKSIHYLTLAANQNHSEAQFRLGYIYEKGEYTNRDIDKSIHYLTLAANQNHSKAQFHLGYIYEKGEYTNRDINKSIHYLTLAANQNHSEAQFRLGNIFISGEYVKQDINKGIHYLTLAGNQNNSNGQLFLGLVYKDGIYVKQDINKAIHYLTLAANQNNSIAQFYLAGIYVTGEFVARDINKAIHYFTLAANQNYIKAQYCLGDIYKYGEFVPRNIDKAIHYYTLAANQNFPDAQLKLALFYYSGEYVTRDINKTIHYFTLAAKQNIPTAHFVLGVIYLTGDHVPRDINKAIYYFTLAANQNDSDAQFNLGAIYQSNELAHQNIDKAIYYYSLAANQNDREAQYNLGYIYETGEYLTRNISKAIYYYSLAVNQNDPKALYALGKIFFYGEFVSRDINKAIRYITLSAKQNNKEAQYFLAITYLDGIDVKKDIQNGLNFLVQSAENGHIYANFALGYIYHQGKLIEQDINKAIKLYKESSSFYHQYAKNNLGVIYKNGFGENIQQNLANAEIYFTEAINEKNDSLSMYNLANLYIYHLNDENNVNKSIKLLIKSFEQKFEPSILLLCLVLIKLYDTDYEKMKQELKKNDGIKLFPKINQKIDFYGLNNPDVFYIQYKFLKNYDFLYNYRLKPISSADFSRRIKNNDANNCIYNIDEEFYNGFGLEVFPKRK